MSGGSISIDLPEMESSQMEILVQTFARVLEPWHKRPGFTIIVSVTLALVSCGQRPLDVKS